MSATDTLAREEFAAKTYHCLNCKKQLTAAQVHRKGNQGWTVEYHFCNDCVPCSSRGTGVTKEWGQRPEPTEGEKAEHAAAHAAYMAQFEGRGHLGATRCQLCGDFGVFADSKACPDCDQVLLAARKEGRREQREADAQLLERWAEYYRATGGTSRAPTERQSARRVRAGEEPPNG